MFIRMLPDGSRRARIHWFQVDMEGPLETPEGVKVTPLGSVKFGGVRGRIACTPSASNMQYAVGQHFGTDIVLRSDDPRAATCPECMKTEVFGRAMQMYEEAQRVAGG